MKIHLDANLTKVYERLSSKVRDERAFDNLRRLIHGEPCRLLPKHKYAAETGSGIGFCTLCYSDDMNDGNHVG